MGHIASAKFRYCQSTRITALLPHRTPSAHLCKRLPTLSVQQQALQTGRSTCRRQVLLRSSLDTLPYASSPNPSSLTPGNRRRHRYKTCNSTSTPTSTRQQAGTPMDFEDGQPIYDNINFKVRIHMRHHHHLQTHQLHRLTSSHTTLTNKAQGKRWQRRNSTQDVGKEHGAERSRADHPMHNMLHRIRPQSGRYMAASIQGTEGHPTGLAQRPRTLVAHPDSQVPYGRANSK